MLSLGWCIFGRSVALTGLDKKDIVVAHIIVDNLKIPTTQPNFLGNKNQETSRLAMAYKTIT
jgi:hypothetical protein